VHIGRGEHTDDELLRRLTDATARDGDMVPASGAAQGANEIAQAGFTRA
jgi:hypothetical protein